MRVYEFIAHITGQPVKLGGQGPLDRGLTPWKKRAHYAVQAAVRDGTLVKGPCEKCGATEDICGHHTSYEKEDWLKVQWLCRACHRRLHNQLTA